MKKNQLTRALRIDKFTAAALERKNTTVEAVKEELLGYLKEDAKSEGYIAEGR